MKIMHAGCVAIVILLISCSQPSQNTQFGNISGTVINVDDGAPVEGVQITTVPATGSVFSGADGSFGPMTVEAKDYLLVAAKTGCSSFQQTITVGSNKTATVNVILSVFNKDPFVKITGVRSSYHLGDTINISVSANDTDGTIQRVDFYLDGTLLGSDFVAPYTYNLPTETRGVAQHEITVSAIDNKDAISSEAKATEIIYAVANLDGLYYWQHATSSGITTRCFRFRENNVVRHMDYSGALSASGYSSAYTYLGSSSPQFQNFGTYSISTNHISFVTSNPIQPTFTYNGTVLSYKMNLICSSSAGITDTMEIVFMQMP